MTHYRVRFRFVTFLKEWAATASEPNVYDVAVIHLILNSLFQFTDDEVGKNSLQLFVRR